VPFSAYSAPGDLRQGPGCAAYSQAGLGIYEMGDPKVGVLLPAYDPRGGGRNEMRACQTRGSAESALPQALPGIAVQRSTATLEVSR
jgi:hypothetical protein